MLQYLEVILLIVILPCVWLVIIYNLFVRDRNRVTTAWADIDVQLKRRHDLIPKLIEAVQQYAKYESATVSAVTELRNESQALANVTKKSAVEESISVHLLKIIAIAEDYPDLKANQSFLELQQELSEVENTIQYARRYYNGAVRNFNIRIDSFPDLFIARLFHYQKADFFEFKENTGD